MSSKFKSGWKRFGEYCWFEFGVGSFWPILVLLLFIAFLVLNSINRYSANDVDEIRAEYEQQIGFAREDGYAEGYHEAELDHEEDYIEGSVDGFYEGYEQGYDDGYDDGINNRHYEESYAPRP